MKRSASSPVFPALILVLALTCLVSFVLPLPAAERTTGGLWVSVKTGDASLEDHPAMVSAILPDGRLIAQTEALLNPVNNTHSYHLEPLPEGICDVRVEGDGFVTEVKKGVQVFAGRDGRLETVARPGEGVHIVEYAVAGLSREEVAARLARLETDLAQLQAELAKMQEEHAP